MVTDSKHLECQFSDNLCSAACRKLESIGEKAGTHDQAQLDWHHEGELNFTSFDVCSLLGSPVSLLRWKQECLLCARTGLKALTIRAKKWT